jgi:hypothetical protein
MRASHPRPGAVRASNGNALLDRLLLTAGDETIGSERLETNDGLCCFAFLVVDDAVFRAQLPQAGDGELLHVFSGLGVGSLLRSKFHIEGQRLTLVMCSTAGRK